MSRYKTFDATGIAPAGKLFAGDINAIQDRYVDLTGNFSQTVDLGSVRLGETGLQLLRYGSLEARLTGALRTDGILRGLGGLFAGQFTTTQRDAIASGSRPYGLIIFNITTNRYEQNLGTDASPSWQGLGRGIIDADISGALGYAKVAPRPFGYGVWWPSIIPDLNFRNYVAALQATYSTDAGVTFGANGTVVITVAGFYKFTLGAVFANNTGGTAALFIVRSDGYMPAGIRGNINAGSDPAANVAKSGIWGSEFLAVSSGTTQFQLGGFWSGGGAAEWHLSVERVGA